MLKATYRRFCPCVSRAGGAAVADERSQQPVLGEVANISDKLVSQSAVSQTASTTC